MHSRFVEESITVLILCNVYSEGRTSKSENGAQLLLTLNEHNCFITLIFLKHFSTPRKDCYIFLLNVHFVIIKNEHGNVHFNFLWFQIFQITVKDNVILLHD